MKFLCGALFYLICDLSQYNLVRAENKKNQAPQIQVSDLENYLFNQNDSGVRRGPRTDAIVIFQDGKVIYEKYDRGYDSKKLHIVWSVSKTVTALMYGVAHQLGLYQLDQSVCDFDEFPRPEQCQIKVRDLLAWTTAIDWNEEYENALVARNSSVLAMLYGEGRQDMAQFVKNHKFTKGELPGKVWRYSSGDSLLAARLLQKIFKTNDLRAQFKSQFFDKIGVTEWLWESDSVGTLVGSSHFYISASGLVKIGQLILNEGEINGKQLIGKDFLQFMKTVPSVYKTNRKDQKKWTVPGASIWLNDPQDGSNSVPWPGVPKDAIAALGHWGQYLLVIPSLKVVAVRFGDTRDGSIDIETLAKKIVEYLHANQK